MTHLSVYKSTL